jgi:UPF0755 protein
MHLEANVIIKPGENVSQIFGKLTTSEQFRIKAYLATHKSIDFSKLEPGTYSFSGNYTRRGLIDTILAGPSNKYVKITVLEGRSIYDIDASLAKKGISMPGDYVALVTDPTIIVKYQSKYPFLQNINLESLEGFLYPDTYNVDAGDSSIDQLVYLQLETFKKRVRTSYESEISKDKRYQTMIMASIIEKEERNDANKATVAGIFYKRLAGGMKLDADITLCYGLHQGYEACTPSVIARNLDDTSNPYNTRANRGLVPQPICNPSVESILAALHPQTSNYLFYLHDNQGIIHYGSTIDEHNTNKRAYLQ